MIFHLLIPYKAITYRSHIHYNYSLTSLKKYHHRYHFSLARYINRPEGSVGLRGRDREGEADGRDGGVARRQEHNALQGPRRLHHARLVGHEGDLRRRTRGYRQTGRRDEEVHQVVDTRERLVFMSRIVVL